MKKIFIDINVFVRFLVRDNDVMANDVKNLFLKVESGKIKAESDLVVIAELVWVLSSYFKIERNVVFEYVSLILKMKNLFVKDEQIIVNALSIFCAKNIDFIDCFCAAYVMKRDDLTLCSYDKDFDKVDGIKRVEPAKL